MTREPARLGRIPIVAPVSHSPMRVADDAAVAALNRAIAAGAVVDRSGRAVRAPLDGALIADADRLVFPVQDGIPVMLLSDSIPFQPDWESELGTPTAGD